MRSTFIVPTRTVCAGILAAWTICLIVFVCQTPGHWWFEDDPKIYHFAAQTENPLNFFFDKAHFAPDTPNEVIPLLSLSFWLDYKIAPRSVVACYAHSAISFLVATLCLFVLLDRSLKNRLQALLVTFAWTLLPSTIATHEFLSTRSYMEGFALACLALYVGLRIADGSLRQTIGNISLLTALTLGALLAKEFYPVTVLPLVFAISWRHRKFAPMAAMLGVGAFYAIYRLTMVGSSLHYRMPFLPVDEIPSLLLRLPYMFAGHPGGYLVLGLAVIGLALGHKQVWNSRGTYGLLLIAIVTSLVVLYPIAFALMQTWNGHGTWVRSAFVLNSLVLVLLSQIIADSRSKFLAVAVSLTVLGSIGTGTMDTVKTWNAMKIAYEREGRFVVEGPPGLLYSALPAYWFLPGLIKLYPEARNHRFIQANAAANTEVQSELQDFDVVWRYVDGKVQKDPALYLELLARNARAKDQAIQ